MTTPRRPDPVPLMTPAEVAQMFRVDVKTVTRWAASGRLSWTRTPGGHEARRRAGSRPVMTALILILLLGAYGITVTVIAWRALSQLEQVISGRHAGPRAPRAPFFPRLRRRGKAAAPAECFPAGAATARESRTALLADAPGPGPRVEHPDANASVHLWGPPVDVYQQMALRLKEHDIGPGACPWAPPEQPAVVRQTMVRDLTGPIPACTDEQTREMYHRQPDVTESVSAWRPDAAPVYGEVPVAGVLEAERQDAGLRT